MMTLKGPPMSDDMTPKRPEGTQGEPQHAPSAPRVEVEPTPLPPTGADWDAQRLHGTTRSQGPTPPTAQSAPRPAPRPAEPGPDRTCARQVPPSASAGPTMNTTSPDASANQPMHMETRTVVKTKSKKLPIFLASFLGLVLGAVLVIALVMSGAFRITQSDVEAGGTGSAPAIKIDPEDTTLSEAVAAKCLPSVVSITAQGEAEGSGGIGSGVILDGPAIKIDPEDTTLSEAVAAKCLPSVVSITAQGEAEGSGGIGSGVILDGDGNILTNYHVIAGAVDIMVRTDDGSSYEAEIVGTDESSDLAVVRLKDVADVKLTPIEIADSDDISVGEWVMAIGSPFGNEQSVSTGIVSALYRSTALQSTGGTSIYANMIQTDAAINPGNSGGALVNAEGKLIGINSVIESYSGSSSGVGFAIPVNYAINIAEQIIAGEVPVHPYLGVSLMSVNVIESYSGSSSGVGFAIPVNYAINIAEQIIAGEVPVHPYLGVSLMSVNAYNARKNGLSVDSGAYVAEVNAEGPAYEAGIEKGDIVVAVNGEPISSADGLIKNGLSVDSGAYVAEVNAEGPAYEAGIEKGDIVVAVNGEPISSADGLIIALREHEVGDKVTLTVVRGKKDLEVEVALGSDEALQAEQEDMSDGNGAGGMTEEELLRYLEEYMNGR